MIVGLFVFIVYSLSNMAVSLCQELLPGTYHHTRKYCGHANVLCKTHHTQLALQLPFCYLGAGTPYQAWFAFAGAEFRFPRICLAVCSCVSDNRLLSCKAPATWTCFAWYTLDFICFRFVWARLLFAIWCYIANNI